MSGLVYPALSYLCGMVNRILPFLLLFAQSLQAQVNTRPRLVVGVVVDQMRPDYLTRYGARFGSDGFIRMMRQGHQCKNVNYNYAPTTTAPGHASIYTGTTPAIHGIAGNDWYDRHEGSNVYCTYDSTSQGTGGFGREGQMSPSRLLTTTVTDQLKLATRFQSKVIGVSLKDRGAILPAGRSADAAYWYDGKSGNWITSTWYMNELPGWAKAFNDRRLSDQALSASWKTLYPVETYVNSEPDDSPYEATFTGQSNPVFPYDLPTLRGSSYDLVRKIPAGNTITKDFAIAAIAGESLGADSITDFLCISFSATDYIGHQFGPRAIETEDTYLRLDRDLADLLRFLDERVGKNQYLVFLTADHACMENPKYLRDHKLNSGFLDNLTIEDTIKNWLTRQYGNNQYFKGIFNDQVILDDEKIRTEGKDLCAMETEMATFIRSRFNGLHDVLTGCDLETEAYHQLFKDRIQRGHHPMRSGHLWLVYAPGWTDRLYGADRQCGTTHHSPFSYDTHVPLLWYGWKIKAGIDYQYTEITDIAPTLSFLLDIPLPNGATGKVIGSLLR